MKKESRIVREYYYQNELIFKLGYVNARKARPPLNLHTHGGMMEFVYIVKGNQIYNVDGIDYTVGQGEVFFTHPHEIHSTNIYPEEVSEIYYLQLNFSLLNKIGIFASPEEYTAVDELWPDLNRIYKPSPSLSGALKQLMSRLAGNSIHYDSLIRNSLSEVIIALSTPQYTGLGKAQASIANSLEYIHSHIEEPIRVSELPPMDHLSLSAYHKAFARTIGIPPGEYILKCKIEKAKELLASANISITDIAFRLGFSSSQYFATVFKRFCYTTPTLYRKSI